VDLAAVLVDAFERVRSSTHRAVDGLSDDALTFRPGTDTNSIAWLVWHIARIQDDHISELRDGQQIWITGGWRERFGFPFPPSATGYDHTSADVAAVRAPGHGPPPSLAGPTMRSRNANILAWTVCGSRRRKVHTQQANPTGARPPNHAARPANCCAQATSTEVVFRPRSA